jgi:peptidoglycan hydrolase-like protein with peptidoglycan-binding domain
MNVKPLLDLIGKIEANGNYNAKFSAPNASEDLSQYTVQQIQEKQYAWGKRTGSSAFGKYQFLRKTLKGLMYGLDLSSDLMFTPELQDKLAEQLLVRRGLHSWENGNISTDAFMDSLSKEWASLPYNNGRSYYDGDGLNHSLVSRDEVRKVLNQIKSTAPAPVEPISKVCQKRILFRLRDSKLEYDTCVQWAQMRLNSWAAESNTEVLPLNTDGKFGRKTQVRVRLFQAEHDHELIDGIIGKDTWEDLLAYDK